MLDEKLLRKALEQAEAMAQVARQMAARGAPVPLMPETVFSKQVGCTPLHTPQERLDRGRRATRRTSGGRRGRGGCLRAVGRGTRARAAHSHPTPAPTPGPMISEWRAPCPRVLRRWRSSSLTAGVWCRRSPR